MHNYYIFVIDNHIENSENGHHICYLKIEINLNTRHTSHYIKFNSYIIDNFNIYNRENLQNIFVFCIEKGDLSILSTFVSWNYIFKTFDTKQFSFYCILISIHPTFKLKLIIYIWPFNTFIKVTLNYSIWI